MTKSFMIVLSADQITHFHCCQTLYLVVTMVYINVAKAHGEVGGGEVGGIPFVVFGKNFHQI